MATLSFGQKAHRVLDFFMGMRHPLVVTALRAHGFTAEDQAEGFRLLVELSQNSLRIPVEAGDPTIIERIDQFENKWFPVAKATLDRRFPAVGQVLFTNLEQTEGAEVLVSVTLFLQRLREMERGEGAYGTAGSAARTLLAQRGLTAEAASEVEALISSFSTLGQGAPADLSPSAREKLENDLWAWYLEWSTVVRNSVTNRRALRGLGFLKSTRSAPEDEEDAAAPIPSAPSNNAPTPSTT